MIRTLATTYRDAFSGLSPAVWLLSITSLINRLEERGWVERHGDSHDGRVVLAALTGHGRAVHERLRSEYRALLHEEMASLQDDDVRTLAKAIDILDRLIERVTGQDPA